MDSGSATFATLILAAGYGARLKPLTDSIPKPLVTVAGKSLLERHLEFLSSQGLTEVIINLHHLGSQIEEFVGDGSKWGLSVHYSREQTLLDTGGALAPIEKIVSGRHLLIVNADSFFLDQPPLSEMRKRHFSSDSSPLATLAVRSDAEVETFGSLGLNSAGEVVRFLSFKSPKAVTSSELKQVMYCGYALLSGEVFRQLPQKNVFSLTRDVLGPAVERGSTLLAVEHFGRWFDVGTHERLNSACVAAEQH